MRNTTKVLVSVLCILSFASVSASAQKLTVFGGYQLSHIDEGFGIVFGDTLSTNMNGWNASLTFKVSRLIGITADGSGTYSSSSKVHTYAFGPEVGTHVAKVRPFAHALFGGWSSSGPVSEGATQRFAMFYGGGLDVKLRRSVSLRLGQLDWMITRVGIRGFSNSVRYSAGVVLAF